MQTGHVTTSTGLDVVRLSVSLAAERLGRLDRRVESRLLTNRSQVIAELVGTPSRPAQAPRMYEFAPRGGPPRPHSGSQKNPGAPRQKGKESQSRNPKR